MNPAKVGRIKPSPFAANGIVCIYQEVKAEVKEFCTGKALIPSKSAGITVKSVVI